MASKDSSYLSCSSDGTNQSEWLQTTLSDMNKKMISILTVLKDGNDLPFDSNVIRQENGNKLTQMIEELHESYCDLAKKYDHVTASESPRSSNSTSIHDLNVNDESTYSHSEKLRDNHNGDDVEIIPSGIGGIEVINFDLNRKTFGDFIMGTFDGDKQWHELKSQVTRLMEENLQRQAELIKRNREKRDVIRQLCTRMEQLKSENRALQNYIKSSKNVENSIFNLEKSYSKKLRRKSFCIN